MIIPIDVTPEGKVTDIREEQLTKAYKPYVSNYVVVMILGALMIIPMDVTLIGIVIFVRDPHP